jgi:hypothetical protein
MLLEGVDEKLSTNMREEAVSCPRKVSCAKATSETHVKAMSNCNSLKLQHSKTYGCIYDGDSTLDLSFTRQKMNLGEYRIPRIGNLNFNENGNTVTRQRKIFNINEELHRGVSQRGDTNMNVSGGAVWSCPRICIDSTKETGPHVTVDSGSMACGEEDRCPVIRLSVRKPRHWKCKLTTSASSPAIILPVIRLLDEHGDPLLDTGEKCESGTKSNSTHVDTNGNDKDFLAERSNICSGNGDVLNNVTAAGTLGKDFRQKQKSEMTRNRILDEGQRSMISEGGGPEDSVEARRTGAKNQKVVESVDTSSRSLIRQKDSDTKSQSDGPLRSLHCIGTPRNKVHRRILERRRNRGDSSTSCDSSPEVRRRTRRRNRVRGRTVFYVGHISLLYEVTELKGRWLEKTVE